MLKQLIHTNDAAPSGGAYSQCLRVGNFIFTAGQGPVDASGKAVGNTIEEQTTGTLENVKALLEAAGATLADVVKVTVHLSDLQLFAHYNSVYARYFPDPKPVRTTVGSQLLGGFLIEIDVIASIGDTDNTR